MEIDRNTGILKSIEAKAEELARLLYQVGERAGPVGIASRLAADELLLFLNTVVEAEQPKRDDGSASPILG